MAWYYEDYTKPIERRKKHFEEDIRASRGRLDISPKSTSPHTFEGRNVCLATATEERGNSIHAPAHIYKYIFIHVYMCIYIYTHAQHLQPLCTKSR